MITLLERKEKIQLESALAFLMFELVSTMASEIVDPGEERSIAGEYISFAFNVGIAGGTVLSFIIAHIIFL